MPRIYKSSPVVFTEEELKFIAFVSANIGGDSLGYRGMADNIHRKLCSYFGEDVCDTVWYDRMRGKVNFQMRFSESLYFTAQM